MKETFMLYLGVLLMLLGTLSNLICAYIFKLNKTKDLVYRWLHASSLAYAACLAHSIILIILIDHYLNNNDIFYDQFFIASLASERIFNLICSLLTLITTIQRYFYSFGLNINKNKEWIFRIVILSTIIISIINFLPFIIANTLNSTNDVNESHLISPQSLDFKYVKSDTKKLKTNTILFLVAPNVLIITLMIIFSLLILLKIKTYYSLSKYYIIKYPLKTVDEKEQAKQIKVMYGKNLQQEKILASKTNKKTQIKLTTMILIISMIFIFDHIFIIMAFRVFVNMDKSLNNLKLFVYCAFIVKTIFHSSNILVYYIFYKNFAYTLRKIFRNIFRPQT